MADAEAPLVGVIMGSDSDLPCMSKACEKLKEFGVRAQPRGTVPGTVQTVALEYFLTHVLPVAGPI